MIMKNIKSVLLTLIQYTTMLYLIIAFPVLSGKTIILAIELSGVLLGIWSVFVMSKSKLNIAPVPRVGSHLINAGPYRFIRHPMYLSLLFIFVPMMILNNSVVGWVVFGVFFINLILKLSYEEQLLNQTFENYGNYQQQTWRLIPFIY